MNKKELINFVLEDDLLSILLDKYFIPPSEYRTLISLYVLDMLNPFTENMMLLNFRKAMSDFYHLGENITEQEIKKLFNI